MKRIINLKILHHLRKISRENDIKIKKIISFTKKSSGKFWIIKRTVHEKINRN